MDAFTQEQLGAIQSEALRIAVMAGPGSGKTGVLVELSLIHI